MAATQDGGGQFDFHAMTSIGKYPTDFEIKQCTDWVATEKVHGSSFQLSTKDGRDVHVGSRTRSLDHQDTFLKCTLKDVVEEYSPHVVRLWHVLNEGQEWASYRKVYKTYYKSSTDEGNLNHLDNNNIDVDENDAEDTTGEGNDVTRDPGSGDQHENNHRAVGVDDSEEVSGITDNDINSEEGAGEKCHRVEEVGEECVLRVYGELYGGGGIKENIKQAVQKEIIYCDDFRFYVFGLKINDSWLNIRQHNHLCDQAGFPYYARPVNEPMETVDELKEWLVSSGFMKTKSALTELPGDQKTLIEGVVMTPLTKPDHRIHAVKFLAPNFSDVRMAQNKMNFCTKQRYHSVISKLDTYERMDTERVVALYIEDIIKESPDKNPKERSRNYWRRSVLGWLQGDGYLLAGAGAAAEEGEEESTEGKGKKNLPSKKYLCTRRRYQRVIDEMDEEGRRNSKLVVAMVIEDIIKDSAKNFPKPKIREWWKWSVIRFLQDDGYYIPGKVLQADTHTKPADQCTRERYERIIGKLDVRDRGNGQLVADKFIEQNVRDNPTVTPGRKIREYWRYSVIRWLREDGYLPEEEDGDGGEEGIETDGIGRSEDGDEEVLNDQGAQGEDDL